MPSSLRAPIAASTAASPSQSSGSQPLLERERERAAIREAVARALGGAGTTILIEGEAGIGKSTLVRHAARLADEAGLRVLRAQGGELERALPYGIVLELFGPAVRHERTERAVASDLDGLFAGAARLAAPLLTGEERGPRPGDGAPVDQVAYLHGLFWLVLNLAEQGPLLIAVDDAQWADEPSLRFLEHLAKRVAELPVVLIVGMRPASGSTGPAAGLLRAQPTATHLEPQALSEDAAGELLEHIAGRAIDAEVRRAAFRESGGNPFYVTELATSMPLAAEATHGAAPALPEGIGRHVEGRLATMPPEARAFAEAVAILGESATLHRAANLSGLAPDIADRIARDLVVASILADAHPLAFRHPIVRSAVDAAIPSPARAELHRRAGLLLADEGADAAIVGAHLRTATATADERVVELLLAAAGDALARGEPKVATGLLERAREEPPGPDLRPDVLEALGRITAAACSPVATAVVEEALALIDDVDRRARLQLDLGNALVACSQWPEARDVFKRALDESPEASPAIRARLEAGHLSAGWVTLADRAAIEDRVRRILSAEELGTANRELAAWVAFHQGAVIRSTAEEMRTLVRRIFAEAPIEALVHEGQTIEVAAGLLLETDDLAFEQDMLTRALDVARRSGPIAKAGIYAYCRAWPSYYMGRLSDAIGDGEEALRAADLGWEAFVPAAVTVTALAHVERDDLDSAEQVLATDMSTWAGRIDTAMLLPLATGRLALARGDVAGAAAHLRAASEGAASAFMRNSVPTDWRAWLATALLRLDRRDEARPVAGEGLEIARAWGARWPLGAALRVAGLVEGGAAGIALLKEGEELLAGSPAQLEHARLLTTLGATLRRHGSLTDAREALSKASDLAQRIGARAILRRAQNELRAAGARPRRIALTGVDALTPGELRVANEALSGRTNREIAQALFVTPKAVEYHLANAYRKLGIASRAELAAAMGRALH